MGDITSIRFRMVKETSQSRRNDHRHTSPGMATFHHQRMRAAEPPLATSPMPLSARSTFRPSQRTTDLFLALDDLRLNVVLPIETPYVLPDTAVHDLMLNVEALLP